MQSKSTDQDAMDAKTVFYEALAVATAVVDQVTPDDFHNPTPNTEWTVRRLAGHMLYELCWVADLLGGKTIKEIGTAYNGDLIGRHGLEANWHATAGTAKAAVAAAQLDAPVHLSAGDVTAEEYLLQVGADLLIHAWDLGEGINESVQFSPEIAQRVYDYLVPTIPDLREKGEFAAPVEVPEDTSIQIKLLALTGRSLSWRS